MNHSKNKMDRWWLGIFVLIGMAAADVAECQVIKKRQKPGLGNEIEGAVWQYTATRKKKDVEEKLQDKVRISGTAIFEVPMKRFAAEREKRIGDIITEKDEKQLVFNEYKKLDGRAFVKKEKEQKNDLWVGYFVDKEKSHWKFELRKIED